MAITHKRIISYYDGIIPELSGVYGPIFAPFWCDITLIQNLVIGSKEIGEVLPDGSIIMLTANNYNTDNGGDYQNDSTITQPTQTPGYSDHVKEEFDSEEGLHREIRFFEGKFQYFNDVTQTWDLVAVGGSEYTGVDTVTVDVGGFKSGMSLDGRSIDSIVERLFNPIIPPVVSVVNTPSESLLKEGDTFNPATFNFTVTKGQNAISFIKVIENGVETDITLGLDPNTNSYTYSSINPMSSDTIFHIIVNDGEQSFKNTYVYEFVLPKFVGVKDSNDIIEVGFESSLDTIISKENVLTYTDNLNDQVFCFAFPASKTIVDVRDQHGFVLTDFLTESVIDVTLNDSTVIPYKVVTSESVFTTATLTVTIA